MMCCCYALAIHPLYVGKQRGDKKDMAQRPHTQQSHTSGPQPDRKDPSAVSAGRRHARAKPATPGGLRALLERKLIARSKFRRRGEKREGEEGK
jgi:hypothetical protein